jgi:hypothetical protein
MRVSRQTRMMTPCRPPRSAGTRRRRQPPPEEGPTMTAYRRPGYPRVPASEGHVLHVMSTHRPFAAQFLAAEERHGIDTRLSVLNRCRRESKATSRRQAAIPMRLRQSVGSALIRLGVRLAGAPTAVATTLQRST